MRDSLLDTRFIVAVRRAVCVERFADEFGPFDKFSCVISVLQRALEIGAIQEFPQSCDLSFRWK
jgi:hypothetical protein